MEKRIHAVYRQGLLHPTEPLALPESQEVTLAIGLPPSDELVDTACTPFFSNGEWEAARHDSITHEDVQRALAGLDGSLAQTVIDQRDER